MDFTTLFKEFVFPVAISIVLLWFVLREVWRFVLDQIKQINADRKSEREEFLAALHELTTMAETQHNAAAAQSKAVTDRLEQMTVAIKAAIERMK